MEMLPPFIQNLIRSRPQERTIPAPISQIVIPQTPDIFGSLRDVSVDTEGLLPGQTPIRDESLSKGGRKTSRFKDTVLGIPIDWEAWENAPSDRKNFYYVDTDRVGEVIENQYRRYADSPENYGLSDDSTLEDMIRLFDQQAPENKINALTEIGIDLTTKIKDMQ